ncbi:MAG TPA: hypothetical protein VD973_23520 [Symbiobacteriaceae bacterium]|nr:hypothetical protein [Symbiobacteriaceae bacterium]
MAGTIDQLSSLAHPSWREAVTRAARVRTNLVPDTQLRTRQAGLVILDRSPVQMAQATGFAAYTRQVQQYTLWKEAAQARPVRTVSAAPSAAGWAARERQAKGALIDLRL